MGTARRVLCCLAAIASILAFPHSGLAQGRRGPVQPLPENPADIIQTLNGFKLELVLRADPQRNGSWISMNKDDNHCRIGRSPSVPAGAGGMNETRDLLAWRAGRPRPAVPPLRPSSCFSAPGATTPGAIVP